MPAATGIPLTHRDHAESLVYATGHLRGEGDARSVDLDWTLLSRPRQTVVIYMGVGTLPVISAEATDYLVMPSRTEPAEIDLPGEAEIPLTIENVLKRWPVSVVACTPPESRIWHKSALRVRDSTFDCLEKDFRRFDIRPGKAESLAQAARKRVAQIADVGLISMRQAQHELMDIRELRRLDDHARIGAAEPRDIVGDRAGQQRHVLGQVADVRPQILVLPGRDVGEIDPDIAGGRRNDTADHPAQQAFSRTRRAHY